ncbi:MAG: hypothetical protein E7656_04520 [Ruminococcaceae bacterium]|nr:hypothetical protein [Oscillospiraceae bacterium]
MLTKVFSVLVSSSFVFALLCGRMSQLGDAIINGASDAVTVSITMLGMLCLWKGIINVLDGAGVTKLISRISRPILCRIYPAAFCAGIGTGEISANFAANFLGLGNAALPMGLSAMEKLSQNSNCYHDMMTFSVLATCPIQLIPTTLITLRSASGSSSPYAIIAPILVCSLATVCFAVALCRICAFFDTGKRRKR